MLIGWTTDEITFLDGGRDAAVGGGVGVASGGAGRARGSRGSTSGAFTVRSSRAVSVLGGEGRAATTNGTVGSFRSTRGSGAGVDGRARAGGREGNGGAGREGNGGAGREGNGGAGREGNGGAGREGNGGAGREGSARPGGAGREGSARGGGALGMRGLGGRAPGMRGGGGRRTASRFFTVTGSDSSGGGRSRSSVKLPVVSKRGKSGRAAGPFFTVLARSSRGGRFKVRARSAAVSGSDSSRVGSSSPRSLGDRLMRLRPVRHRRARPRPAKFPLREPD